MPNDLPYDIHAEMLEHDIPTEMQRILKDAPSVIAPFSGSYARRAYHHTKDGKLLLLEAKCDFYGQEMSPLDLEAMGADIFTAAEDVFYYVSIFDDLEAEKPGAAYALEDGDMVTLDGSLEDLSKEEASESILVRLLSLNDASKLDEQILTGAHAYVAAQEIEHRQIEERKFDWHTKITEEQRYIIGECRMFAELIKEQRRQNSIADINAGVLDAKEHFGLSTTVTTMHHKVLEDETWTLRYQDPEDADLRYSVAPELILSKFRTETLPDGQTIQSITEFDIGITGFSWISETTRVYDANGKRIPTEFQEKITRQARNNELVPKDLMKELINRSSVSDDHAPSTEEFMQFLTDLKVMLENSD